MLPAKSIFRVEEFLKLKTECRSRRFPPTTSLYAEVFRSIKFVAILCFNVFYFKRKTWSISDILSKKSVSKRNLSKIPVDIRKYGKKDVAHAAGCNGSDQIRA
jgi:hypothetical protein